MSLDSNWSWGSRRDVDRLRVSAGRLLMLLVSLATLASLALWLLIRFVFERTDWF